MSRPHGRGVSVDSRWPRAQATCDRCGSHFNHHKLQWQYEWQGPKLQNLHLLVCPECLDVPQEQLRTIILPADPTPIDQPRIEAYASDDNPVSSLGTPIGTISQRGGLQAAFDGNINKSAFFSAGLSVSTAGLTNTIGLNWGTNVTYAIGSFTMYAPSNAKFLASGATAYQLAGSMTGAAWTAIASGTTAGTTAEVLTVSITNPVQYQYVEMFLTGDGTSVAVAQLVLNSVGGSGGSPF